MKKILIVDDEDIILEFLSYEFSHHGHLIYRANSGNEAILILKKNEVDVIFSDVRMKNGNGHDLLVYINSIGLNVDFYFMSADVNLDKNDFSKYRIKDFFSKPFDIEELLKKLNE